MALSATLSPTVRRLARTFSHIDVPSERSSHRVPTPKSGGIAILIAILGASAATRVAGDPGLGAALLGAVVLSAVALLDEHRSLPRLSRLAVQVAVAIFVVRAGDLAVRPLGYSGGSIEMDGIAAVVAIIWVVGFINVYNFMDGVNGLASVQAIVGGAALVLLLAPEDLAAATLAVALAAAAAGFLPWNFPRASMFMGDTGSNAFGLLFAVLILRAVDADVQFPAAALPFAPFLFDASVTIAIRIARRERFFSTPHRIHFYQRLLDRGWTHAQVTGAWGGLAAISAGAALLYPGLAQAAQVLALTAIIGLHVAVAVAIMSRERAAAL